MDYEKQPTAQSNLYPTGPTSEKYPPPYASFQSPPPGGMAYPQYPSSESGGPPAYGHPAPGSDSCGQPQPIVVMSGYPQTVVVAQPSSVSMIGAIVLSCFVFWCCGCLVGFIAFILALVGQSRSSDGNSQNAIKLRNASYGVSIVGIVIGVIITILFIVYHNRHLI